MSIEENRAIVRRAYEFWNTGDAAAIDRLVAPDLVMHLRGRSDVAGVDAYRSFYAGYRAAFPDQRWTIEELIAEADTVVALWTLRATHRGELMGIAATGREVTVTGISVFRIADGRIAENWVQSDILGLLQQLGAVPPIGRAG
jgi:steroid delta-isomerase-like uncharacterized protein